MARLAPQGPFRQFTNNGVPLVAGKLYTYESGTVTPKPTYTDATESTANANPTILDANGRANIWLGSGAYTWVLKDSADATIWSQDNISGEAPAAFGATIDTVSSNLAISETYANALLICTSTLTLSLLAAAVAEEGFYFIVKNSGTGLVTIDPNASETIDGVATITIKPNESAVIICNGTLWYSIFRVTSVIPFSPAASTGPASLEFAEDTDNGTNKVTLTAPAALGADATVTLPSSTGTLATLAGTEALSNKTITASTISSTTLTDSTVTFVDNADPTKQLAFECSGIATGTTRTLTAPNASGTIALTTILTKGTTAQMDPLTAGSVTTVAHGMSSTPNFYSAYLECKTAEHGWSIGDRIAFGGANDTPNTTGIRFGFDATNTTIVPYSVASISIVNKSTRASTTLTLANWKLVVIPMIV